MLSNLKCFIVLFLVFIIFKQITNSIFDFLQLFIVILTYRFKFIFIIIFYQYLINYYFILKSLILHLLSLKTCLFDLSKNI